MLWFVEFIFVNELVVVVVSVWNGVDCFVNIFDVDFDVFNVIDVEFLIDLVVLLLMIGFVFLWLDVFNDGIMIGEFDVNFFDFVFLEGNEDIIFVVLYVVLLNGVDEVEIEGFLFVDVGFDFGVVFILIELLFFILIVFVGKIFEILVFFFLLLVIFFWRWCFLIKLVVLVLKVLIWVFVWVFSWDVFFCVNVLFLFVLFLWWFCFDWLILFIYDVFICCFLIISKIYKLVILIYNWKVLKCILKNKKK